MTLALPDEVQAYPDYLKKYAEQYSKMTDAQRVKELQRLAGWSVEIICRSAVLIREMIEHDQDISGLEVRFDRAFKLLREVAHGRLAPQVVYRFRDQKLLLGKLKTLPPESQKEIAEQDNVPVAVKGQSGGFETRMLPVASLTKDHIEQVFAPDGLRTFEQQVAWAEGRPGKTIAPAKKKAAAWHVDRRLGGVWVRKPFLRTDEIEAILEQLRKG